MTALVLINVYFLVTTLANIAYFRRATLPPSRTGGPFVSVIVPARNEAPRIERCVRSLLAQDYADYEVIVVDDESSDATPAIVASLAAGEPRLRLVTAGTLPEGWLGKPFALTRGAAAARGEIFVLADADTVHRPQSISWAVTNLLAHDADMLSGYLAQEYGSLGERIVVPVMYLMMLVVPFSLLPRSKSARLAFAVGQMVAVRRDALERVGGYAAVRDSIVDDMSMARRMKECGHRIVFLDASGVASCRLYTGYGDAFRGTSRSVYAALGANPPMVAVLTAVVTALIAGPAFSVLLSIARLEVPSRPVAFAVAAFLTLWILIARDRGVPLLAIALYPFVFLNLLAMLYTSMIHTGFGRGIDWKGRLVRIPTKPGDGRSTRPSEGA